MILQDAYEAAQVFLDNEIRPSHEDHIVIVACTRLDSAWVFGYNARRFIEQDDLSASLVGNGPVVVKHDGSPPYIALSGTPVEDQVD